MASDARRHSAGHLMDVAMKAAGCSLEPTKGYHYSPGAYVEYAGKLGPTEREALQPLLQEQLARLIAEDIPTEVSKTERHTLRIADRLLGCSTRRIRSHLIRRAESQKARQKGPTEDLARKSLCGYSCGSTQVPSDVQGARLLSASLLAVRQAVRSHRRCHESSSAPAPLCAGAKRWHDARRHSRGDAYPMRRHALQAHGRDRHRDGRGDQGQGQGDARHIFTPGVGFLA